MEPLSRWGDASKNIETAYALLLDADERIGHAASEDEKGRLNYGAGRGDYITPTQIVRTIDEARRLLFVAKRELG